ncbi:hypothetical protein C8J57DRAFT_1245494 [Mycena rebaudengoi]|nr:hypothetical protein C8J57DRAFT_1245494 [Mycena rebaudengoi]
MDEDVRVLGGTGGRWEVKRGRAGAKRRRVWGTERRARQNERVEVGGGCGCATGGRCGGSMRVQAGEGAVRAGALGKGQQGGGGGTEENGGSGPGRASVGWVMSTSWAGGFVVVAGAVAGGVGPGVPVQGEGVWRWGWSAGTLGREGRDRGAERGKVGRPFTREGRAIVLKKAPFLTWRGGQFAGWSVMGTASAGSTRGSTGNCAIKLGRGNDRLFNSKCRGTGATFNSKCGKRPGSAEIADLTIPIPRVFFAGMSRDEFRPNKSGKNITVEVRRLRIEWGVPSVIDSSSFCRNEEKGTRNGGFGPF